MSVEQQIQESLAFVDTCVQLKMLSEADAESLRQSVVDERYLVAQEAMQRGWLTPADVEIVQSLRRPLDVVPGYEILDVVGRGGMGVVYRARQLDLDRVVALKTILINSLDGDTTAARFEREAKALARLQHPNIVQALSFGQHHGRYYFAMEFVSGSTCEQLVTQRGRLDPADVWQIVRQVASGLMHALKQGLIHRDIKPANLILMPPPEGTLGSAGSVGIVKITDFGLAMFTEHDPDKMKLTTGDKIMGSPAFMSPEQYGGNAVDFRSDIYSLGATAWNLLFGKPPFEGGSVVALYQQKMRPMVISDDLPINLVPDQWQLLMGMMDPNPDRRPDSYEVLVDAIDQLGLAERLHETTELSNRSIDPSRLSISEQPTVTRPAVEMATPRDSAASISRGDASPARDRPGTDGSTDQIQDGKSDTGKLSMNATTTTLKVAFPLDAQSSPAAVAEPTVVRGPTDATAVSEAARTVPARRLPLGYTFGVVAIGLLLSFVYLAWPTPRGPRGYRRVISSQPLYDGVSLAGWDVGGSMVGAWNAVQAPDASTAIACTTRQGALSRPLPSIDHPRVSLFVWLLPDSGPVDIDFGLGGGQRFGRRGCLRLDATHAELGIKSEDFGELMQSHRVETPVSMLDRYHVIYIEKQVSDWYVFLEESLIGTIPIDEIAGGDAIRVVVHGSRSGRLGDPVAYFSDLQLSELAATTP